MTTGEIIGDILILIGEEYQRAAKLHPGVNPSRHHHYGVILEELDEYFDEVRLNPAKMSDTGRDAWQARMKHELIQTAAMCVRAIVEMEL